MKLINTVLFLLMISLSSFSAFYYFENRNKLEAFDQCIEDISNKCSRSISYAILLEKENARLNSRYRECRNFIKDKK